MTAVAFEDPPGIFVFSVLRDKQAIADSPKLY
jgi:hypothetical protein